MIWEHCLVVGHVYPYLGLHRQEMDNDHIHDEAYYYDTPAISLLCTYKRIREEAELLLYKRNTFVLPNVMRDSMRCQSFCASQTSQEYARTRSMLSPKDYRDAWWAVEARRPLRMLKNCERSAPALLALHRLGLRLLRERSRPRTDLHHRSLFLRF